MNRNKFSGKVQQAIEYEESFFQMRRKMKKPHRASLVEKWIPLNNIPFPQLNNTKEQAKPCSQVKYILQSNDQSQYRLVTCPPAAFSKSNSSGSLRKSRYELERLRTIKIENIKLVETILLTKPSIQREQMRRSFNKHREASRRLSRYNHAFKEKPKNSIDMQNKSSFKLPQLFPQLSRIKHQRRNTEVLIRPRGRRSSINISYL